MNPRFLLLLISAVLVTSCAGVSTTHKSGCSPGPKGPSKEIRIPLVFTPQEITKPAKTRQDCARPGDVLVFMLNGRPGVDVEVKSDDVDAPWFEGSNKIYPGNDKGRLWITIPLSAKEGDFKYTVTAGAAVLDPAVRVRHSY